MSLAQNQVAINIDCETYDKFEYACSYYGLMIEDQIIFSIRHFVSAFENEHGEININFSEDTISN